MSTNIVYVCMYVYLFIVRELLIFLIRKINAYRGDTHRRHPCKFEKKNYVIINNINDYVHYIN